MDMLGSASLMHAGLTDLSGLEGLSDLSHHHHAAAAAHHHYYAQHHVHQGSHHVHPSVAHHHQPHQNQPLPPHRPFTPPTASALTSLQSSLASVNNVSTSGIVGGVDPSYSPNSTSSHLPTSTVKIKAGKLSRQKSFTFTEYAKRKADRIYSGSRRIVAKWRAYK